MIMEQLGLGQSGKYIQLGSLQIVYGYYVHISLFSWI